MELKLVQVEDDVEYKEFKLCNQNGEQIVSFDVEINRETALISYETKQEFRHKGFASYGLNLLKQILFRNNILFLELINLSGDYSRKVAENAGFFSPNNTLNYYISLNPNAEDIVNSNLGNLPINKKSQRLLEKIRHLKISENNAKQKLHTKLEQLLQEKELVEQGDYKKYIESEISHLEKILAIQKEEKNKML